MVSERTSFIALWVMIGLSGVGAVMQFWAPDLPKPPRRQEVANPRPQHSLPSRSNNV